MPRIPKSRQDHSDAKWFIIIGVLLALFAGSVILLAKSPQIKVVISPREQAPTPAAPSPAAPEAPVAVAPEGLPEGGSVELVNITDSDGNITDQQIVWRVQSGDTVLVESVNTLIPALENGRYFLKNYARPTAIGPSRVFFSIHPDPFDFEGLTDQPIALRLVSFDSSLSAFISLVNAPDVLSERTDLSPNQHRIAYADAEDQKQNLREIWVYNLVKDKRSRVLSLAISESLTSPTGIRPEVQFEWKDPTLLQYKVYRAEGTEVGGERQLIATRTVKIEP